MSASRSTKPEIKYKFVKYEKAEKAVPDSKKPNNVTMTDYTQALQNNRHDLKMVARFEVDRANRKVERAANQRPHESKKMRQTYSIMD